MLKFLLFMLILMNFLPCVNGYTNYVSYSQPVDLTKENKTLAQQNVDLQNAINNSTYLSDKVKTI